MLRKIASSFWFGIFVSFMFGYSTAFVSKITFTNPSLAAALWPFVAANAFFYSVAVILRLRIVKNERRIVKLNKEIDENLRCVVTTIFKFPIQGANCHEHTL